MPVAGPLQPIEQADVLHHRPVLIATDGVVEGTRDQKALVSVHQPIHALAQSLSKLDEAPERFVTFQCELEVGEVMVFRVTKKVSHGVTGR